MNDRFTVRAVVVILGVFALAALTFTAYLLNNGKPADSVAVISGAMGVALGGLAALLASTRVTDTAAPDTPVVVSAAPPVATVVTGTSGAPVTLTPARAAAAGPVGDAAP